jgi:hypothetical protein
VPAGVKAYAVISMRRCARVDWLAYGGGLAGFAVCLIRGVGGALGVLGGGHVADFLGVEVDVLGVWVFGCGRRWC